MTSQALQPNDDIVSQEEGDERSSGKRTKRPEMRRYQPPGKNKGGNSETGTENKGKPPKELDLLPRSPAPDWRNEEGRSKKEDQPSENGAKLSEGSSRPRSPQCYLHGDRETHKSMTREFGRGGLEGRKHRSRTNSVMSDSSDGGLPPPRASRGPGGSGRGRNRTSESGGHATYCLRDPRSSPRPPPSHPVDERTRKATKPSVPQGKRNESTMQEKSKHEKKSRDRYRVNREGQINFKATNVSKVPSLMDSVCKPPIFNPERRNPKETYSKTLMDREQQANELTMTGKVDEPHKLKEPLKSDGKLPEKIFKKSDTPVMDEKKPDIEKSTPEYPTKISNWSDEVEQYEKNRKERGLGDCEDCLRSDLGVSSEGGLEKRNRKDKRRGKFGEGEKFKHPDEAGETQDSNAINEPKRQGGLIKVSRSTMKEVVPLPPSVCNHPKLSHKNDGSHSATRQLFNPRDPGKPLVVHIPNERTRSSGDSELVRKVAVDDNRQVQVKVQVPAPKVNVVDGRSIKQPYPMVGMVGDVQLGSFDPHISQFNMMSCRVDTGALSRMMLLTQQLEAFVNGDVLMEWSRIAEIRTHLFGLYKMVLLADLKFFETTNMELHLWKSVFYNVIEALRRGAAESLELAVKCRALLVEVINQGIAFFTMLLESLESTYRFHLEDYLEGDDDSEGNWARPRPGLVGLALISAQKLCLYMGDLARYKECYCEEAAPHPTSTNPALKTARRHYLKAMELNPKNGRCYNQMAFISLYNGRKFDAVYYYCRSLMTVNAFQSAKESLLSIFEDTKRKWEEKKRQKSMSLNSRDKKPTWKRPRREIWIRPDTGVSKKRKVDETENPLRTDLDSMSRSELIKEFTTSFLLIHGMLFTKVNFETFEEAALDAMGLFRACVRLNPFPFSMQRLEQLMILNMFAVEMNAPKDKAEGDAHRAVISEHGVMLMMEMMSVLLEQACCNIFDVLSQQSLGTSAKLPHGIQVSSLQPDSTLKTQDLAITGVSTLFLPVAKIWCDWLISHPSIWNPSPPLPPYHVTTKDVWQNLADLVTLLQRFKARETDLIEVTEEELEPPPCYRPVWLTEDKFMAGFFPMALTHDPVSPMYCGTSVPRETAEITVRILKLEMCCEFMCGLDPPFIKYTKAGNSFVSLVPIRTLFVQRDPKFGMSSEFIEENKDNENSASCKDESRQEEMYNKISTIFETLKTEEKEDSDLEVLPKFLVPDTNCLILEFEDLKMFLSSDKARPYTLVVPLLVMAELEFIVSSNHEHDSSLLATVAPKVYDYLRVPPRGVRFCTTRGNFVARYVSGASEVQEDLNLKNSRDPGKSRVNDETILACCHGLSRGLDSCTAMKGSGSINKQQVVLLTNDRNLRVKGMGQDEQPVPCISLAAFLRWLELSKSS